MKRLILAVIAVLLVATIAWAAGVSSRHKVSKDSLRRITWAAMTAVGNFPTGTPPYYTNPDGKTERVECTFSTTGDAIKSIWIQTSANSSTFTNATSSAMDVDPADSDSLMWRGEIFGGPDWRLHVEDTDIGVANSVTAFCDIWR